MTNEALNEIEKRVDAVNDAYAIGGEPLLLAEAMFLAHAMADVPSLVAEIRRVRALAEKWRVAADNDESVGYTLALTRCADDLDGGTS